MKNLIIGSVIAFILVLQASPVRAETATATLVTSTNTSMLMMMQTLMKQVEMLQKQLTQIQAGMKEMPVKANDAKDGEVREKVRGVVGGMGTTSVISAITSAELAIEELAEVTETITDTKLVKKTDKVLAQAKRKLADAEKNMAKNKYRDALAKALQAKRLAERGLAEVADEEEESIDDKDDDDEDEGQDDDDDDEDKNR